jgi:hypothetical protein
MAVSDIDPVAFALERVDTLLCWIDEHRASFEAKRGVDEQDAERELGFLADATRQAKEYMHDLKQRLLAGETIDPSKRLPKFTRTGD